MKETVGMPELKKLQDPAVYERLPALLLPWFADHARDLPWRHTRDPYRVWLSEIMLQQTRVEAVKGYYTRFLDALPDLQSLANVPEQQLLKLWEGLGYYNRARNLQKAARVILEQHAGMFPRDYQAVLALPGIGAYTAGAICSTCFDTPTPAVDGNVLRVLTRVANCHAPIDVPAVKQAMEEGLCPVYPKGNCREFTQSLMELGATVCLPNGQPLCQECPLGEFCTARAKGTVLQLPVKSPKRPRKREKKTVFYFTVGEQVALCKRQQAGLLAGLWQLPETSGFLSEGEALEHAARLGLHPLTLTRMLERNHIFTHMEWEMRCFYIPCGEQGGDFTWGLPEDYPLPTAFRQFIPIATAEE